MPFTTTGKNTMLDAGGITHAAVFSGDPTGAGVELDRQPISFSAAAAGAKAASTAPQFAIGAGETVDHVAFFNAASGGTMLAYDPVPAETFNQAGTYTLSSANLTLADA